MNKDLLDSQRKSILKILESHSNDNLAAEASRDLIAYEILESFPKKRMFKVNVGSMVTQDAMLFMQQVVDRISKGEDLNVFDHHGNISIEEEPILPAHDYNFTKTGKE